MTSSHGRPWHGALAAGAVAAVVLFVPIVGSLFLASVAVSGCLFGACENAQPDVPVAAMWLGMAAAMVADIVLWAVAGARRMARPWLIAAISVLLVPLAVLVVGHVVGAI